MLISSCLMFELYYYLVMKIFSNFYGVNGRARQVFGSRADLTASIGRMFDQFWTRQKETKNGIKTEIVCEIRKHKTSCFWSLKSKQRTRFASAGHRRLKLLFKPCPDNI